MHLLTYRLEEERFIAEKNLSFGKLRTKKKIYIQG